MGQGGGQFTSNLRPRWTDPVTARRVPSKWTKDWGSKESKGSKGNKGSDGSKGSKGNGQKGNKECKGNAPCI